MTRPAWHGVRVGDEVRIRGGRVWWRVTKRDRARDVPASQRVVTLERSDRHSVECLTAWLTDIAERRRS